MKNLIDRDEILDILDERFGFWDFVRDLINKHDLDDQEDSVLRVADDILEGIRRFVESAEVFEEREETSCFYSTIKEEAYDYFYNVHYYTCGHCFESIESIETEEDFKFCPYCGAKYTKIVKEN